jgi:type II secretory pathway component PulM
MEECGVISVGNILGIVAGGLGLFVSIVSYVLIVARMKWEIEHVSSNLQKVWAKVDALATLATDYKTLETTFHTLDKRLEKMEEALTELHEAVSEMKGDMRGMIREINHERD